MAAERHEVRIIRVTPTDDSMVEIHGVCLDCDERFEFSMPHRDYFRPGRVVQVIHEQDAERGE